MVLAKMPSWIFLLVDKSSRWARLFLSGVLFVSGPLLSIDFDKMATEEIKWSGPLSFISNRGILWTFLIAAALNAAMAIYYAFKERTISSLKKEITQTRDEISEVGNTIQQLFNGMLYGLAQQLEIAQEDQIRITLYIHDKGTFSFIPCGRYSPNPRYQDPGRPSYPENQGCIGKGWENGWHFDSAVPENGNKRKTYHAREYGMDGDVVDALAMKSCLYAAKRLHDAAEAPVAVIVVEAIDSSRFEADNLRAILENIDRDYGRIIRTLRSFIPTPFNAAASGL
ncbi:hypothetical protein [Brucella anthropi]|uniref:hypothetical protein n=1 Tax=Brucella anthropi TaxID=529 RepID=UPI000774EEA0|nr:hypothetical protein [Brucella anthropi]KXO74910.1 hypothetical protein AYJ56_10585 [Brucella anthropi]